MTTRIENGITIITADTGKTFVRKWNNFDIGKEIYLGMNYFVLPARFDTPEDFDEVDEVNLQNNE